MMYFDDDAIGFVDLWGPKMVCAFIPDVDAQQFRQTDSTASSFKDPLQALSVSTLVLEITAVLWNPGECRRQALQPIWCMKWTPWRWSTQSKQNLASSCSMWFYSTCRWLHVLIRHLLPVPLYLPVNCKAALWPPHIACGGINPTHYSRTCLGNKKNLNIHNLYRYEGGEMQHCCKKASQSCKAVIFQYKCINMQHYIHE